VAPRFSVRTIEVHGGVAHGAVPSTKASLGETNVTEVAANMAGTGPPAGWSAGAIVGVGVACGAVEEPDPAEGPVPVGAGAGWDAQLAAPAMITSVLAAAAMPPRTFGVRAAPAAAAPVNDLIALTQSPKTST
jgi:hypothetical protein